MNDEWVLIPAKYLRDHMTYRSVSAMGRSAVRYCGFQTDQNGASSQTHVNEELHLIYVLEGRAQIQIQTGPRQRIEAGHVIQILPQTSWRLVPEAGSGWACACMGLDRTFAELLIEIGLIDPDKPVFEAGVHLSLTESFDQIASALCDGPDETLAWTALQAQHLVLELAQQEKDYTPSPLVRCCALLSDHLDEPVNLESLSREVSLPVAQLRDLFRTRMGIEPADYRQYKRLDRAKSLLGDKKISLDEIAQQLGYRDTGSFTVQFKRRTGQSPQQFRQTC